MSTNFVFLLQASNRTVPSCLLACLQTAVFLLLLYCSRSAGALKLHSGDLGKMLIVNLRKEEEIKLKRSV
jgi:hypothetical protein